MAATLSNRAFFVSSEPHVSKGSSSVCHSSCPLSNSKHRSKGVCGQYVSFLSFLIFLLAGCSSHDLPGCIETINRLLLKRQACVHAGHMSNLESCSPFLLFWNMNCKGACLHTQRIFSIDILHWQWNSESALEQSRFSLSSTLVSFCQRYISHEVS